MVWLLYSLSGYALFYVRTPWRCSCLTRQQCCRSGADRHSSVCTIKCSCMQLSCPIMLQVACAGGSLQEPDDLSLWCIMQLALHSNMRLLKLRIHAGLRD